MDEIPRIDKAEKTKWDAYSDTIKDLVAASSSQETDAAIAAMQQASKNLDPQAFLNAIHVPEDAGEHEAALEAMLKRIPDGWGRWVSCSRGWYPLVVSVDEQIRAALPGYQINQIKEKFGELRYYWDAGDPDVPGHDFDFSEAEGYEAYAEWVKTPEGAVYAEQRSQIIEGLREMVAAAEEAARHICEVCGQPGQTRCTRSPSPWLRTLCDTHAKDDPDNPRSSEYITQDEWDAWWKIEKPLHEQRHRDMFAKQWEAKRALMLGSSDQQLSIEAEHITNAEQAAAAALDDYDGVWIGEGPEGAAFITAFLERHVDLAQEIAEGREAARIARTSYIYPKPKNAPLIYSMSGSDPATFKPLETVGMHASSAYAVQLRQS